MKALLLKLKVNITRVEAGACVPEHGYCCGYQLVYDCGGLCKFSSTC